MQLLAKSYFHHDVLVIALEGEVTLSTLPLLSDILNRQRQDHNVAPIAINLDALVSLDDAGLGILLGFAGRLRGEGRSCVVACSQPGLRERLASTGFDRAVNVVSAPT